ncbi:unnamed protein product [Brachionus calyciflorus]|uniref:Uncharacterized protein n=1 Tax=Brachionus calyciflorus TaxID=104777 RepID=A0A814DAM2_9BILA|nr:unnamed protein product [Brachionus calyciflorus]
MMSSKNSKDMHIKLSEQLRTNLMSLIDALNQTIEERTSTGELNNRQLNVFNYFEMQVVGFLNYFMNNLESNNMSLSSTMCNDDASFLLNDSNLESDPSLDSGFNDSFNYTNSHSGVIEEANESLSIDDLSFVTANDHAIYSNKIERTLSTTQMLKAFTEYPLNYELLNRTLLNKYDSGQVETIQNFDRVLKDLLSNVRNQYHTLIDNLCNTKYDKTKETNSTLEKMRHKIFLIETLIETVPWEPIKRSKSEENMEDVSMLKFFIEMDMPSTQS